MSRECITPRLDSPARLFIFARLFVFASVASPARRTHSLATIESSGSLRPRLLPGDYYIPISSPATRRVDPIHHPSFTPRQSPPATAPTPSDDPPACACGGTSFATISGVHPRSSASVKSKSGGSGRPLGNRVPGSLSSSKYACAHASNPVNLASGEYTNRCEMRSSASGLRRLWNTLLHGCALICGNLNSV